MKKVVALMLVSGMVIGLTGCGAAKKTESTVSSAAAAVESTVSSAAAATESTVSSEVAAAESTAASTAAVVESKTAEVESVVEEAAPIESAVDAVTAVESVVDAATAVESVVEAPASDVMSYADFCAAAVDDEVCVETYVQAKQSWWEDKATVYTQNEDGAFFVYNMACSEEDYNKLVEGQKIKVTGFKAEWSGEAEIIDSTFEIEDGNYIAPAVDVTDKLGTDELINYMNQKVMFKGMTVETSVTADAESTVEEASETAFLYKWDGSGQQGDDIYFKVSNESGTYTFTVESYLCDKDSDVYKAVEGLKVGDKIDLEGFLYWYEGAQPHITAVNAAE